MSRWIVTAFGSVFRRLCAAVREEAARSRREIAAERAWERARRAAPE